MACLMLFRNSRSMITPRRRLGDEGEALAVDFLQRKRYAILARNYRTRFGELDIVATYQGRVVVIEVKTRRSTLFGSPEEAINARKQVHLRRMAAWYMMKEKRKEKEYQIDCIAVDFTKVPPELRHLENIVQAC